MKAYRIAHPRDRRAYKAAYDAANRARNSEYHRQHHAAHRAESRAYYLANRVRILARVKARAEAKKAEISAYHAAHYADNTARIKAAVAAHRKANPEQKSILESRRRARKAGNGGSHTLAERREKFARLGNVCHYCRRLGKLTVDHDLPLARGGTDDIANILPACQPCNSKKKTLTAAEFLGALRGG